MSAEAPIEAFHIGNQPLVSRRGLLHTAALGVGAVLTAPFLAACGDEAAPQGQPATPDASPAAETITPAEAPDLTRLDSYNEIVRGIGAMEERCDRKLFAGLMTFFDIPADRDALGEAMTWQPASLWQTEEARFDLPPVVILEPAAGSLTDLTEARARTDAYFAAMKENGVTDEQMGRVVVAPEPIVGGLGGSNPARFVESVNMYRASLRQQFPEAESTILIDTAPEERSVLVEALRSEQLDTPLGSVGVQAYANGAPIPFDADGRPDISGYLTADAVAEIAEAAGTDQVWLNTGIIREDTNSYALGSYTLEQRVAIANAIADVVQEVQDRGLTVDSLVLFAENKLHKPEGDPEGRDFSFHPGDEQALITLADRLKALDVPLLGYDVA